MFNSFRIAILTDHTAANIGYLRDFAESVYEKTHKMVQVLYVWNKYPYLTFLPLSANTISELKVIRPKLLLTKCILCAQCARNCKYKAIKFNKSERTAKIDYQLCMSCNVCMKFCKKEALAVHSIILGKKYYHDFNGVTYIGGISDSDDLFYPDYLFKSIEKDLIMGGITLIPVFKTDDFFKDEVLREADLIIADETMNQLSDEDSIINNEFVLHTYIDVLKKIPLFMRSKYDIEMLSDIIIDMIEQKKPQI